MAEDVLTGEGIKHTEDKPKELQTGPVY